MPGCNFTIPPSRSYNFWKFEKMKKTTLDIHLENMCVKFELDPITLKGPNLGGTDIGPETFLKKIKKKNRKMTIDSKYDFCPLSFKTKFRFL